MSPGTEFGHDFCAGIGPLQLGVVLVLLIIEILLYFLIIKSYPKEFVDITL